MLGFDVSERTVSRYLQRLGRRPEAGQSWLTFLHNRREAIAVMDLFVLFTVKFRLLYALFIIRHGRTIAREARLSAEQMTLVASTCDTMVEWRSQRSKQVYRFVAELDQLRALHIDYRAEETAEIKGRHTVMVARDVAKIDGQQIYLG